MFQDSTLAHKKATFARQTSLGAISAGVVRRRGCSTIPQLQDAIATGVILLFAAGQRPTRAAIWSFTSRQHEVSLTHDPSEGARLHLAAADGHPARPAEPVPEREGKVWVELLREGLTFDLRGLAPGPPCAFPVTEYRFDLAQMPDSERHEALQVAPGPHLAGGERSLPVIRSMLALVRDLTRRFEDLEAIVWEPSRSAIGRRFFESVVTAWLEGGPFPALGLTAFRETADGGLQSVGLDFWVGQELQIEPPLCADKVAATRLGVRLINQLVILGGLSEDERIVAPDGTRLVMGPSRNRRYVRVWRE